MVIKRCKRSGPILSTSSLACDCTTTCIPNAKVPHCEGIRLYHKTNLFIYMWRTEDLSMQADWSSCKGHMQRNPHLRLLHQLLARGQDTIPSDPKIRWHKNPKTHLQFLASYNKATKKKERKQKAIFHSLHDSYLYVMNMQQWGPHIAP
jgi:hypothetical protein